MHPLVNCTVLLLRLLLQQYELGKISHNTFEEHVSLKLQFLRDHLPEVENRKEVELLMDCCKRHLISNDSLRNNPDCFMIRKV